MESVKGLNEMVKKFIGPFFHNNLLLGLFLSFTILCMHSCEKGYSSEIETRSDVINIGSLIQAGGLEREPVFFLHDKHTDALLKMDKNCQTCHPEDENGKLSLKFKRHENPDKETFMEIYHDNCISCHKDIAAQDKKSGPVICGECHKEPNINSAISPLRFDKSLHQRHVSAENKKCENCHHQYNTETKELFYIEKQEQQCIECHQPEVSQFEMCSQAISYKDCGSYKTCAHSGCISCHQKRIKENAESGPVKCEDCHKLENQLAFKKAEKINRLDRNQPNIAVVHANEQQLKMSKMKSVIFNHELHENNTENCSSCHLAGFGKCSACHLVISNNTVAPVKIEKAMHSDSRISCIGCHNIQKDKAECLGCHVIISGAETSDKTCEICHNGPVIQNVNQINQVRYTKTRLEPTNFSNKEVPETVSINVLKEKYEEVILPHKKIIAVLQKNINNSELAKRFHQKEDMLCQGCHHNSPAGQSPALCMSCHSLASQERTKNMPAILGAYHQMCIGCHQEMNLEHLTSCTACHAKKENVKTN
jgi:hypothetical protein